MPARCKPGRDCPLCPRLKTVKVRADEDARPKLYSLRRLREDAVGRHKSEHLSILLPPLGGDIFRLLLPLQRCRRGLGAPSLVFKICI
jgi:hypothetical protein